LKENNRPDFLNFGLNGDRLDFTICFDKSIKRFFTPTSDELDELFNIGYMKTIEYFKN
jgi:hypothetical protein